MHATAAIDLDTVRAVYSGAEYRLWELIMGEQIHIGGLESSMALADAATVAPGSRGIDLCCCTGAGMRFLLRFRDVAFMTGVDATPEVIAIGKERSQAEGLLGRIEFVLADACNTDLEDECADFVWGEDAWCYVADKPALIREAVRLVRPGGVVAFTDWIAGDVPMEADEAERLLLFMKFPTFISVQEYVALLEEAGMHLEHAADTGRFAPCVDLYVKAASGQFAYDVSRLLGFDNGLIGAVSEGMRFMQGLAHDGKLAQAMFVARKPREARKGYQK